MPTISEALELACKKLHPEFRRSIHISTEFSEIITRAESILIPASTVEGANLLELCEDIIRLSQSFDQRVQEERARYLQELEDRIRSSFERLSFYNPERANEILLSLNTEKQKRM